MESEHEKRRKKDEKDNRKYERDDIFIQYLLLIQRLNGYRTELHNPELQKAVHDFMVAKNNNNELSEIPNIEGHEISKAIFWNNFVKTKTCSPVHVASWVFPEIICTIFSEAACSIARYMEGYVPEEVSYERFVRIIDECHMRGLRSYERDWQCAVDDERYALTFNKWQNFRLLRFDMKTDEYIEIQPIANAELQQIEVEFKTGNLMIADWFSTDDNKLSDYCKKVDNAEYEDFSIKSINSSLGCEQRTKSYYEKLGIIHVCVSNTSPNIFQSGDDIVVGYEKKCRNDFKTKELYQKYADKTYGDYVKKGHVCTDLWWTTIMEEEKLVEILGCEYHDEYKTVTRLKVKPG